MPFETDNSDVLKRTMLAQELQPKQMLAVYQVENGKTYIEIAKVDAKGRVLSFAPLGPRAAFKFAEGILRYRIGKDGIDTRVKGWVNGERIVYISVKDANEVSVAWKRPPGEVEVKYAAKLGISDGVIDAPGILFSYTTSGRALSVKAYKKWAGQATQLYHLPFHNVYEGSGVCMGNSKTRYLSNDTLDSFTRRVEWLFFNTAASEIHFKDAWKGNINTLHKELREGKPFPMDKLIRSIKMSELLKRHNNA